MTSVVIHYGELALKGRNRPWFITMLRALDSRAACPTSTSSTRGIVLGRIEVRLGPGADWEEVRARLARLPGIGNFSRAPTRRARISTRSPRA